MKKFLLILLLAILPLQYTWAAAAAYCEHEKEVQASHPGHHPHEHQTVDGDSDDQGKVNKVHSDCGVCQFSAQASFLTTFPAGVPPGDIGHAVRLPDFYSSHIPDGPQKPNWQLVA
ncbi:hypothetical protein D3870_04890 [Noviherbaspirillum cavernae]|uniref:Cobalt-zinc-cadmium resistance protein n=1 Tax=Noviherbaspirillum cavernae TaxID=2320862 RepID=A0A418X5Y1_9BURK|nr:hypothetical protein D3870_04890 [Noviherbaspirillum cavernae]